MNVTKPDRNCGFGHINWRNPSWKTSFLCSVSHAPAINSRIIFPNSNNGSIIKIYRFLQNIMTNFEYTCLQYKMYSKKILEWQTIHSDQRSIFLKCMLSEKSVQSNTNIYIYSVNLYKHLSKKSIFIIFVIFVTVIKNTFNDYQNVL